MIQQTLSKSLDPKSKKLAVSWEVKGSAFADINWNSIESFEIQSDVFGHEDSSDLKWRLGITVLPDSSATSHGFLSTYQIKPVFGEINSKYSYFITKFTLKKRNGDSCGTFGCQPEEYDGKSAKVVQVTRHRSSQLSYPYYLELELQYPDDALERQTLQMPECIQVKFTKETRLMFCDVRFEVEGNIIEGHRILLSHKSPKFLEMFQDASNNPIKITDATFDGFSAFIDLIYCLEEPNDPTICLDIMRLAEVYGIEGMKSFVGQKLVASLTRENVIKTLIAADTNQAEDVKMAAIKFLENQAMKVEEMPHFQDLGTNVELLIQVLGTVRIDT